MAIVFCFDDLGPNPQLGYPNLAAPNLKGDQFDHTWPRCIPLRLLMYFKRSNIEFTACSLEQAPKGAWYPVALAWHDHQVNYFDLMSPAVLQGLRNHHWRVLFYYHEGDNPFIIKQIIDRQAQSHALPRDCYLFISANTKAHCIDNFWFFADHEHFFQYINRRQLPQTLDLARRTYEFTALSRTHKWWRASVMSDLWAHGLLDRSLWSYNTNCVIDDDAEDNPVRIHESPGWSDNVHRFLHSGPYTCDPGSDVEHNDHRKINLDLYTQAYCHLVLETHLDADQSQGAFVTEKTYKCIKHAQPFIIIGTPGSLAQLRDQGYRVFDHAINNAYDEIQDNTQRWFAIKQVIRTLSKTDLHQWFLSCEDDLRHNQCLFMSGSKPDLVKLAEYLDTVK